MQKLLINKYLCAALVIAGLLSACSTEKDAALNVGYHNMTARFNGYFNAGEIIDQSLVTFRDKYKDDYTVILELQVYPSEKEATGLFPDMDKAIEKCSKVIYRHSMPNPNVVTKKEDEHCKWIDDNWLLIGQAHFYKREYDKAQEKFRYVMKEYTGQSSQYAAKIWLAKMHIENGSYSKAKLQLISVKNDIEELGQSEKKSLFSFKKKEKKPKRKKGKYQRKKARRDKKKKGKEDSEPEKFTQELLKEYELTAAQLEMALDNNIKAVEHIENAISHTPKRKEKARYEFILGQIYQASGSDKKAMLHFGNVAKSNANYEMRFYAKINKALSNRGNESELQKELDKMLKDSKNQEYKDQIYYVLADIDLKRGDRAGAIRNLTNSAIFSVNNKRQKAKSYLKLADMHFEDRLYIKSQKYYDSCVAVLPKDHEDFSMIESKATSLLSLVENYEVYTIQDSLQALVELSEKDLEKELKNILKDIKERERQKKINDKLRLEARQKLVNKVNTVNEGGSKWYFYNQKALSRGFNEFKLLWGQRALEDNWRRSNKKQSVTAGNFDQDSTVISVDSLTVDVLRDGLPLSKEALDLSLSNQVEAMYNLGMIYKNQLSETDEAVGYFQKIIDKEYEHEKVLSAAYQLYLIEQEKGNTAKSQSHKRYIEQNYPNSEIAAVLKNPDYFEEQERLAKKDLLSYKRILQKYEYGQYGEAITAANDVIFNDTSNKYLEKYYILKANAISKSGIGGIDAAKDPLIKLIQLSPDSPEGIYAQNYLNKIGNQEPEEELYSFDLNSAHYFLVLIPSDKSSQVNDVKIKVSNFNSAFFGSDQLKITSTIIGDDMQGLMIKSFDNYNKIDVYKKAFMSDAGKAMLNNTSTDFDYLIISKNNILTLFKDKNIKTYSEFFSKNYK
ncbi:MAG: tetratricopeptide repeat protein [Crocinitomicaceae bacterium]